jgi:hypothetical protein
MFLITDIRAQRQEFTPDNSESSYKYYVMGALLVIGVATIIIAPYLAPAVVEAEEAGAAFVEVNEAGTAGARFIADEAGNIVDTSTTPPGSYDQPNGGRTDILQQENHGSGLSHTHDPILNTNPSTGETFINGRQQLGRPVSPEDVSNIQTGRAPRSAPKGR